MWHPASNGITNENIRSLAIDPSNQSIIYAGTEGGGIFKSMDGAVSWAAANTGLTYTTVRSLAIDPKNQNVLYAGTSFGDGIFKSTNSGSSWFPVIDGLDANSILAVAINPITTSIVYAGSYGGGVFKTNNGGTSWAKTDSVGLTNDFIRSLAVDPVSSNTVYTGTGNGVFKTTNGGLNWTAKSTGLPAPCSVRSLAVNPNTSQTVFAGTDSLGLYRSTNGGTSWTNSSTGLTNGYIRDIAINPVNSNVLYVGTNNGVFKSTNSGTAWVSSSTGLPANCSVRSLSIYKNNTSIVYAGLWDYKIYYTTNAGSTWTLMDSEGLGDNDMYAVEVNSLTPQTVYAGTQVRSAYSYTYPPVSVTLTPDAPPIVIPSTGGNFYFTAVLKNNTGQTQKTTAWTDFIYPDLTVHKALGPQTLSLPANGTKTFHLKQVVSSSMPAGDYSYLGRVGTYPGNVADDNGFSFTKLP
jgi:photosystem II stability/assembly factor-like uncharacterized protein